MPTTFDPETWIVNRIYNRIKTENKNAIVGFFGLPRKGKTYSALSLAEQVGAKLKVPLSLDNVTFSVADKFGADGLMARFNERPPRGTSIGLDDAGTSVGANSRKWWSAANEALSTIGQSGGYLGYLLWLSAPEPQDLDSQFRSLFHIWFEVRTLDKTHKVVMTKPQVPYRDSKSGKIRGKYPRAYIPGIGRVRVKKVGFHLPSQATGPFNTWPDYEAKKDAFMRPLYQELQFGLDTGTSSRRIPKWAEKAILLNASDHPDWSQEQLGEVLGVSQKHVSEILKRAHGTRTTG